MAASREEQRPAPLRVAIVGGGIGGLSLATFISTLSAARNDSNADFEGSAPELVIHIYEAAESLTELGAGVGVWLRTWNILCSVSSGALAEDLKCITPPGRSFSNGLQKAFIFRRGDSSPEGRSFHTMEVPFGVLTLHRAEFQRVLARYAIPPAQPHFSKRLVAFEYEDENDPSSEIILKFTDGSSARTDLLIGADGIRSVVRRGVIKQMMKQGIMGSSLSPEAKENTGRSGADSTVQCEHREEAILSDLTEPVWSGTIVYRNLIPLEKLEKRFPGHRAGRGQVVYFGKDRHVLAFPISSSGNRNSTSDTSSNSNGLAGSPESPKSNPTTLVNLVAFVSDSSQEGTRLPFGEPWVRPASRQEVLEKFGGWEDEVLALLELAENPSAWAIHTVKPLPRYSDADGRVVLLGDAAHAMTPHQGSGGGQAIEDAYVLASLLTHPRLTRGTLPAALRAYDAVRVPISQRAVQSSRANGMMYDFNLGWEDKTLNGSTMSGNEEMNQLHKLAETIIGIHRWVWEEGDDSGKSQCELAIRLFEDSLSEE